MILITGATGHIGNVLARELLKRDERLRALVLPGEDLKPLDGLDIELVEGDILNPTSIKGAFQGIQDVFHLAGIISIMPGKDNQVQQVNVQGTHNVILSARAAGVRRLIYTSSIHALTRIPHGNVIDERVPFDPEHATSDYDRSKAQASLAVARAARQGLDAVIACPTGVTGPFDFRRSEMGQLILDTMKDKPQFYVDGAYDFVDVRDVAGGLILARERGRDSETYILSGEQMSLKGLIEIVRGITGGSGVNIRIPMGLARLAAMIAPLYYRLARARPRFTPYALATVTSNSVISNAKARRELGYAPRPLHESIADTVNWFRANGDIRHTVRDAAL